MITYDEKNKASGVCGNIINFRNDIAPTKKFNMCEQNMKSLTDPWTHKERPA